MKTFPSKFFLVLCLTIAAVSFGANTSPAYTVPELGVHADPGALPEQACVVCHDDADPPNFMSWTPFPSGWLGKMSPASYSCYFCHSAGGGMLMTLAHDMTMNAFDNSSHSFMVPNAPNSPDGSFDDSTSLSGLPYNTDMAELECTTCHDPHSDLNRAFLRAPGAAICTLCHQGRENDLNQSRSIAVPGGSRNYSTHPTKVLPGPTATANIKTTPMMDSALRVATPMPPGYQLGGHLNDGTLWPTGDIGDVDCMTCHAVHGPAMFVPGNQNLLAIDNTTEATGVDIGSALCEGCHYGGAAGEQVGLFVLPSPPAYSDHPIDQNINRPFWPPSFLPLSWTSATPNFDLGAQPFVSSGAPACSSCHDVHGGMENTQLLRGPAPGTNPPGTPWTFAYEDWCYTCHTYGDLTPSDLTHAGVAAWECATCHATPPSPEWTAHNGFWEECISSEEPETSCTDTIDNDCDFLFDCDDPDCSCTAPPWTTNALMNGEWYINVEAGTPIHLTADFTDVGGGDHVIEKAEYFLDTIGADGTGTAMSAADGSFDSPDEGVEAFLDTTGWTHGGHVLSVHAYDGTDGWGPLFARSLHIIVDDDGDGYAVDVDCNDADPAINPGAAEIPYNGIDENCNGMGDDDDLDGDGYPVATDCDDTDPLVSPSALEVCDDGIDNDCDGLVDSDDVVDCPPPCSDYTVKDECNTDPDCSWQGGPKNGQCIDDAGCTPTSSDEVGLCGDGIDNDCDGAFDCADAADCGTDPLCVGGACSDYQDKGLCNDDPSCEWVGSPKNGSCQDAAGCTITEDPELTCDDGLDNDCDGLTDTADPDCPTGGSCDSDGICEPGEDCSSCPSDCDGVTSGKPSNRYCCGNGTAEGPEGDSTICDGNY